MTGPFVVDTPRRDRVAREVEVIAEQAAGEICSGRRYLDDVAPVQRASQRHVWVPEHEVYIGRLKGLAVIARLVLPDEADDRGVSLRQLVVRRSRPGPSRESRRDGEHCDQRDCTTRDGFLSRAVPSSPAGPWAARTCLRAPPMPTELLQRVAFQRSDLKAARTSVAKISGSSQAAKWPPLAALL